MSRPFLVGTLLAALCSSCGSGLSFEPYEVKDQLNLEQVLGRDIVLVGADTQALRVRYQPATGLNLVTRPAKGDTLLLGWATRYRRLYYLTEPGRSGSDYRVYAIRAGRGTVAGLLGHPWQLDTLHRLVDRGEFAALVLDHKKDDDHEARLRYDPRALHRFYKRTVAQYPDYRLMPAAAFEAAVAAAAKAKPAPATASAKPAPAAAPLIRSVYPNPAHGQVNVQLSHATPATLELLDARGRAVRTIRPAAAERFTLPLIDVPAGSYVLRLRDEASRGTTTHRLVVE